MTRGGSHEHHPATAAMGDAINRSGGNPAGIGVPRPRDAQRNVRRRALPEGSPSSTMAALRSPALEVFSNELLCRELLFACIPDAESWRAMARVRRTTWQENTPSLRKRAFECVPSFRAMLAVRSQFGPRVDAEYGPLMCLLHSLTTRRGPRTVEFVAAYDSVYRIAAFTSHTSPFPGEEVWRSMSQWKTDCSDLARFLDVAGSALENTRELVVLAKASMFFLRVVEPRDFRGRVLPPGLALLDHQRRILRPGEIFPRDRPERNV
ncbi:hypothetical protein DFJ74DRAFT_678034, partial [Hyaloraphidium curvatum]